MATELEELIGFLSSPSPQLKAAAVDIVRGLTGSDDGLRTLLARADLLLPRLLALLRDSPDLAAPAADSLINLSQDSALVAPLLSIAAVPTAMDLLYRRPDLTRLAVMLLANLTQIEAGVAALLQSFESEDVSPVGEKKPLFRSEDDVNLTIAYLAVTEDPIHGTDQKRDIYWQGVCNRFNNVLNGKPSRTPGSLKNQWSKYILPHLQRMSGIVRSVESLCRSGYTQHNSWLTAKEKYYAVYKKPFNFDKCWDLVKHNPKFVSNVDPYPTGSMYGNKGKGKKVVRSSATITDLTEDSVDSLGDHGEDPIERPMGNKKALKAKRLRDAGVVPFKDKVHSMLTETEELKKSKEEEKLVRKVYLEEKLAATRAHAHASKLQSDFYIQMMEAERTSREDKILYQSIEGLDEASKQYLLEQKNAILLRRRG